MANKYQAYWLIDVVFSYQGEHKDKPFQIWDIWSKDKKALVTMREDDGEPDQVWQEIPSTDFPEGHLKLYLSDKVLLLPSEY